MSTSIRLNGLNLVSADVAATVDFYRALGLDIPDDAIWATDTGTHHVSAGDPSDVDIEIDSVALAQRYDDAAATGDAAGTTLLGFAVDERDAVDEVHDRMVTMGYESRQAPTDAFWGSRHAIVADPDGRAVGIMSPPDDAHRDTPPDV